jgi:hypothetical protein
MKFLQQVHAFCIMVTNGSGLVDENGDKERSESTSFPVETKKQGPHVLIRGRLMHGNRDALLSQAPESRNVPQRVAHR